MGSTTTAIWFAIAAPFALIFLVAAQNDTPGLDPRSGDALVSEADAPAERIQGLRHEFVYTVQAGDTLDGIARIFGIERSALVAANDIHAADSVFAGSKLLIPFEAEGMKQVQARHQAVEKVLREAEEAYELPRGLLLALAWQESHWDQRAVSSRGAIGIGQLMPTTARWIEETLVERPLDWESSTRDNAHAAAAYLAYHLERANGDVWMALAAYYQGAHSIDTEGPGPTTPGYVEGVLSLVARYQ